MHGRAYDRLVPVWASTLYFKEVFDTVRHSASWKPLAEQCVAANSTNLVSRLYSQQTATAKADMKSRVFSINGGTKQVDPSSSLLFNCLSESVF